MHQMQGWARHALLWEAELFSTAFFPTALRSNLIALVYTLLIIFTWYAFEWRLITPSWVNLIWPVGFAALALILLYLSDAKIIGRVPSLDLSTDAQQWAPTAGASMVVGWAIGGGGWSDKEAVMLIAIGILYSVWCIVIASEAKHPEPASGTPVMPSTGSRIKLQLLLLITHLILPGLALSVFSYGFHLFFSAV